MFVDPDQGEVNAFTEKQVGYGDIRSLATSITRLWEYHIFQFELSSAYSSPSLLGASLNFSPVR